MVQLPHFESSLLRCAQGPVYDSMCLVRCPVYQHAPDTQVDRYEEYPKMRELIHRKDSLVAQRATPAYFMQVFYSHPSPVPSAPLQG